MSVPQFLVRCHLCTTTFTPAVVPFHRPPRCCNFLARAHQVCAAHCHEQGAAYAATQYGYECWCYVTGRTDFDRHGGEGGEDGAVCDSPCEGNAVNTPRSIPRDIISILRDKIHPSRKNQNPSRYDPSVEIRVIPSR